MLASLSLALGLSLALAPVQASPPPGPGVHFIAVGQGAAALLVGDGVTVLVDAGPTSGAEAIAHALAIHGVERLDLLVATHFDADHIGGLGPVLVGPDGRFDTEDDIELAAVWDRGLEAPLPQTDALGLYLALVEDRRFAPAPGARFEGPGLSVENLSDSIPGSTENERSLLLCVEFEGIRLLLPGDAAAAQVEAAAEVCGVVDVLWASHHGSADASSPLVIARADPRLTVISAGPGNSYCHPSPTTLAVLHEYEAMILDGAGLWPSETCPAVAASLGPGHQFVGADLWVAAPSLETWMGLGGLWTIAAPPS